MPTAIHTTALLVFSLCFLLVTVAGFLAVRWQRADLAVFHQFVPAPYGGGNQFLRALRDEV